MCQFFSAVVTENGIKFDKTNMSHQDLARGLREGSYVKVEVTPNDGDIKNTNLKNWTFRVTSGSVPAWFNADKAKKQAFEALASVLGVSTCRSSCCNGGGIVEAQIKSIKGLKLVAVTDSYIEVVEDCEIEAISGCEIGQLVNSKVGVVSDSDIEAIENTQIDKITKA